VDSDGKGLNIAYEAVDRHAQNHLKIQLHFVLFEKTEVPKTLPIPIWKHSAKFANVLKK
jgi:acetyl-CoA synthetase